MNIFGSKKKVEEKKILSVKEKIQQYEIMKEENAGLRSKILKQKREKESVQLRNKQISNALELSESTLKQKEKENEKGFKAKEILEKYNGRIRMEIDRRPEYPNPILRSITFSPLKLFSVRLKPLFRKEANIILSAAG